MARLYGRIVEATGWSFAVIDQIELRDVRELMRHWLDEPPLAACVRAWMGVPPAPDLTPRPDRGKPKEITQAEFDQMFRQMQGLASEFNRGARPGQ